MYEIRSTEEYTRAIESLYYPRIQHMKITRAVILTFALACICILSCNSQKSYNAVTVGEMENLIKKGDMSTHISLQDLASKSDIYAIGSATNLKGFIVIEDGRPYTSFVHGNSVSIDSSWNTEATLLVYAQVEEWKEISLPAAVLNWKQLENFVMTSAKNENINANEPFPFLLKGTAQKINWRVSDWKENDKEVTNKKVKNSGLKGEASNVHTTILGFYCTKQYRVLAEHNTKMHLHFVSNDKTVSGHVDDLTLAGGMTLYLPVETASK